MAFQSGTQIRPELANADLSGFQRAAEINAQMLAQLGQDIGRAVQGYREGKIKKERSEQRQFVIGGILEDQGVDITTEDGQGLVKALSKNEDLFNTYQNVQMNQAKLDVMKQPIESKKIGGFEVLTKGGKFLQARSGDKPMTPKEKAELNLIQERTEALKNKPTLKPSELLKLLESEVDGVTLSGYLDELRQTKEISEGKLHQKGFFNLDEKQVTAFDNMIRSFPQLLPDDMPDAVKKYYGVEGGNTMDVDGITIEVIPE